jgi:phospholipid transport system substrate-binding protein
VIQKYVGLLALTFALLAKSADSPSDDAATIQVRSLDDALLKSMQAGSGVAMSDRYRKLEPVIDRVFDLPLMARLSIGPGWTSFSAEQQQSVTVAFARLTVASYAHNFSMFTGQKFEVDHEIASRGADKIVQSQIISPHDAPVNLSYRMRQVDGIWKIIDVSYDGVSELTIRRSDFTAAIAAGGAPVLIAHLNQLSDDLLRH